MITTLICLFGCAFEDHKTKSFHLQWLILPLIFGIISEIKKFNQDFSWLILDTTIGGAMILILGFLCWRHKMGVGDLLIYLVLGLQLNFQHANFILLAACLIFSLDYWLFPHENPEIAFVPHLFLATILILIFLP